MIDRDSLIEALELWFDKPLCELPDDLRVRVSEMFFPISWDVMSPDQRRRLAVKCKAEPGDGSATTRDLEAGFESFVRKDQIEEELNQLRLMSPSTITELLLKKKEVRKLNQQLVELETQSRHREGTDDLNQQRSSATDSEEAAGIDDTRSPSKQSFPLPRGQKPETRNWKMLVQMEAARLVKALRDSGARPSPYSIRHDIARWCQENNVKGAAGSFPSADYIYRHCLRGWKPPVH